MISKINVEPFQRQSSDQIFDLILPIQSKEFGISITRQDQSDLENIPEFYQQGCGGFWVALDLESVVGTIALLDIGNNQVALRKMFVDSRYRGAGRGVARHLLATAFTAAKEGGVTDIFLGTTAQFFAAHRFYEKNGFEEIDKTTLPASFPLIAVDTKFYHYSWR